MMIRSKVFLFTALLLVGNVVSNAAQTTNKDEADAIKLARAFSRRLKQTKDVKPLISEFLRIILWRTL